MTIWPRAFCFARVFKIHARIQREEGGGGVGCPDPYPLECQGSSSSSSSSNKVQGPLWSIVALSGFVGPILICYCSWTPTLPSLRKFSGSAHEMTVFQLIILLVLFPRRPYCYTTSDFISPHVPHRFKRAIYF